MVEPQEVDAYRQAVVDRQLLTDVVELDMSVKERYDYCDQHKLTKSSGSGPARNFIWQLARDQGAPWHWIMDDNIATFYRLHDNLKHKVLDGAFFAAMEDFTTRYSNVGMAGPNYEMFAPRRHKIPPFTANTRIYSCNLIRCDLPFRWRGRYNEDTILSLDMLKAGWCTILFNTFLQKKLATQTMPGGNTDTIYAEGELQGKYRSKGTTEKSHMLARVHPDVAKVVWKFRRVHHVVDYSGFKRRKLIRAQGVEVPSQANEYGLQLVAAG